MSERDRRASAEVQRIAARAARRLDVLEWVILAAAAAFATLAGALAALMLVTAAGLPFRPTWIVASIVLFVVPAAISYRRARRLEQEGTGADAKTNGGE